MAASIGAETASPDIYLFSLTDATQPTEEAGLAQSAKATGLDGQRNRG